MLPTSEKVVQAISPVSVNGAGFVSNVIDTLGFDHCTFDAAFGAIGAAVAALKVQESDAITNSTTLNGGADVVGLRVGTDTNDDGTASALPVGGDANKTWRFEIDLRGRKRYLQIQCTAGAGATLLAALARLRQGENEPTSASQKGVNAVLRAPVVS